MRLEISANASSRVWQARSIRSAARRGPSKRSAQGHEPVTEQLYINGRPLAVTPGQTLLGSLEMAGVNVPSLCYEPRLPPQGTCRLCLVEVDGLAKPVAACTTLAEPGMRVTTESEGLIEYRRLILELLLSETPPAQGCPRCSTLGPCQLHAAASRYGAQEDRFPRLSPRKLSQDPNPFIRRDYQWCIACFRCTRICEELEMARAIVPSDRGQSTCITSFPLDLLLESPCTFCGQCIHTCPTGALMDRKVLRQLGYE